MVQILHSTQTTGPEFETSGGLVFAILSGHAGGTWTLEVATPNGDWVDAGGPAGVEFTEDGIVSFYSAGGVRYRLTGGTQGAEAWVPTFARLL